MKTVKKALVAVLAMVMMITTVVMPVAAANFTDTQDHWAKDHINRWVDAGVLNGMTETTFNPQGDLTRGQIAKIFATMLGLSEEGENNLTDISDHWAKPFILQCAKAGIIMGYEDSTFRPERPVTRQEAYVMVARAMKITSGNADNLDGFSDADKIATWAKDAMSAARSFNALDGSNGAANPEGNITRAEVAALLDKLVTVYVHDGKVSLASTIKDGEAISSLVVVKEDKTSEVKVSVDVDDTTGDIKVTVNANGAEKVVTVPAEIAEEIKEKAVVVLGGKVAEVKDDSSVQTDHKDDDHADFVTPEEPKPEDPTCDGTGHTTSKLADCAAGGEVTVSCDKGICKDEVTTVDPAPHVFGEDGKCANCEMTEAAAMKFYAEVLSGGQSAKATVNNDYVAEFEMTPGEVDPANVKVGVKMQNVASLGVGEMRQESVEFTNTGLGGTPALKDWFDSVFAFKYGKIVAVVDNNEVHYNLEGNVVNNNAVITATPDKVANARKAWAALTAEEHMTTDTRKDGSSDSYIKIANGSYMIVDNDKLCFEKGVKDDLKLDNFSGEGGLSGLNEQIRSKVRLYKDAVANPDCQAKFFLAAGTELSVGSSYATLVDDCTITFTGAGLNTDDFKDTLVNLQEAETGTDMAIELVNMLDAMVGSANAETKDAVDSKAVVVKIDFTEPVEKPDYKFWLGVTANNSEGSTTTVDMTVYEDYNLEINLPVEDEISANEVTLGVKMKDVASMEVVGEKSHTMNITTGIEKSSKLSTWMPSVVDFKEATVNINVEGNKCTYFLSGDGDVDQDWVTITGTTDEAQARAAWQAFAGKIEATDNDGNSYISIAPNSYVNVRTEMLKFEDDSAEANPLVLDNFSGANGLENLKQTIKDAVVLETVSDSKTITIFVGRGTILAVDGSKAMLTADTQIDITIDENHEFPADLLTAIRTASESGNSDLVKTLFTSLDTLIASVDGATLDVVVTFKDAQ